MRKYIIAGNWKMHFTTHEASLYLHKLAAKVPVRRTLDTVVAPHFLALQPLSIQANHRQMKLAAQNCHWRDDGPFTGEVSAHMLRGVAEYVIIGHSERRHIFHEHDSDIRKKVQAALRNQLRPIICIGETAVERAEGETKGTLHHQLASALANVTAQEMDEVVIAYEPVWAIGTGNNARPEDVAEALAYIRAEVQHNYGQAAAQTVRILYGGSVKAANASSYLVLDDCDGFLIGGASLIADEFVSIIEQAHTIAKKGKA